MKTPSSARLTSPVAPSEAALLEQRTHQSTGGHRQVLGTALLAASLLAPTWAQAEPQFPITPQQRHTAQDVAERGVPLSELAPNAPDRYTVKRGDTLWDISSVFLTKPWRWPELWGMNMTQIRNPHLIFPGQVLVLTRVGDRAVLSLLNGSDGLPAVKLSPKIRSESLSDQAIPPIPLAAIEPFLTDSMVVDADAHAKAPRIVAAPENRVLLSRGDRAYARGQYGAGEALQGTALSLDKGLPREFRIYRNAVELRDPETGAVLGYEAQFIGQTKLARGESVRETVDSKGQTRRELEPATIDITLSKEEIRIGDRLLPEPLREVPTYVPHPPSFGVTGSIVKVHGNAVQYAGQNQVVLINRGSADGIERGHVLAVLKNAAAVVDKTDSAQPSMRLPGERNGMMVVFRSFEHVSYALVLQIADAVRVGDKFTNP